ncbi:MAG: hypothetical protein Q8R98_11605 [Rubrivivax sp.]|nr:hypothetical protein [Rubrivivax sp.]MDZ4372072.1 hypothetical protein [Phenylobacterium sp.]
MSKIERYFGYVGHAATDETNYWTPAQIKAWEDALLDDVDQNDGFFDDEAPFDFGGLALTPRQEDELEVYETMRRQRLAEMAEY